MRIIALINQKGGTGKTTSAVNIGVGLSRLKKKILLVDLDPQSSLTYSLGIQAHELEKTVYDVLKEEIKPNEAILQTQGIHLLPSSLILSGADFELTREPGGEALLNESLRSIKGYDFCLIDCPPSLGILTINALCFARELFVTLQVEYLALQGLAQLIQTVKKIKNRLNKKLEITGVIGTRFDSRRKLNREVVEEIKKHFGKKLFNTLIRENISLAEAPSAGKSIFDYKKNSSGAHDYTELCKEILKQK